MLKHRIIFFFCCFLVSALSWGAETFSSSPIWQKLYQYQNNKSKIESQVFFFSPEGMTNPEKELQAAILAFQDTSKRYGTLKLPAACAFPARKQVLEKNLNLKFPIVKCPDHEEWLERLNADTVSIDFAGAYSGNPASILGHTFLRYSQSEKKRSGQELLSYAVGFLAATNPNDNKAMYMIKGLTGQYPGFYQMEPYYMKVGLYNNSESRDIWEQKLNLTPDEVRMSLLLLWEYSFNAQIPYYFIDENCSYRLLSFLEVVKPEVDLLSDLSPVVLPADTVRVLLKNNLADHDPKFRSSILRRLDIKVSKFNDSQKNIFEKSKTDIDTLNALQDFQILDALIDYWTYTNYRAEIKLKPKESQLMEATFLKRSKLKDISIPLIDEEIKNNQKLTPAYLGHKTSWLSFSGGSREIESSDFHGKLSYRMGVHALMDSQIGYEDISAMEYLGFDYESRGEWRALLADVKSIEPLNRPEKKWSWLAHISLDNNSHHLHQEDTRLILKGGGGGGLSFLDFGKIYLIPILKSEVWANSEIDAFMGVGIESGILLNFRKQNFLIQHESVWNREGYLAISDASYSYHIKVNHSIFTNYQLQDLNFDKFNLAIKTWSLGYKIHL